MKIFADSQNRSIELEKNLAGGGEARIWTVKNQPDVYAKIYHQPSAEHEAKVSAMIAAPPDQPKTHTAIAWPLNLLFHRSRFAGFLMPGIQDTALIFQFYNPAQRKKMSNAFTWEHMLRVAYNLTAAVHSVHAAGHVVGDLNESNILVDKEKGFVTLIDADSFQIRDKQGFIFRCGVGKPEFTPPEMQGVNFKTRNRSEEHDRFAMGVMIFNLLMEGVHPFSGVLNDKAVSVGRVDLYCIQNGVFPFHKNGQAAPPPNAPAFGILHPEIQKTFVRCFVSGYKKPNTRPSAEEWINVLNRAEKNLKPCRNDPDHVFSNHLKSCPWCNASKFRSTAYQGIKHQKPFKIPPLSKKGRRTVLPSPQTVSPVQNPAFLIMQWILACSAGWGVAGAAVFGLISNNAASWLIFGFIGGLAQWFVLKKTVSALWIFFSTIQWFFYGTARTIMHERINEILLTVQQIFVKIPFAADLFQSPYLPKTIGMGAVGFCGGILHWLLLRKKIRYSYFWIFVCIIGSAAGLVFSSLTLGTFQYQILDLFEATADRNLNKGVYWATFGAGYAVVTGTALCWLIRNPKP